MRLLILTLSLLLFAGPATAAPVLPGNLGAAAAAAGSELVVPVHRYHRDCDYGWVPYQRRSDWHRHSGRRYIECRPPRYDRRLPRRYDDPYRRHQRHDGGCVRIGGVLICN